jgi:hypothetical protein
MITKPTVLILGAGASINYGFPSGLQLKAEICKEIKLRNEIFDDLVLSTDEDHVEDFYNNVLLSSEFSIDAFLEHNQKYFEIGRRAITNVLIRKEKHVELFEKWIDKWLDPENKDKHWYQLLFSKLNAPFDDFSKNDLKIITFNYDRSLEYFLWESMKAKYSEQDEESILEKLLGIPILHVYGKLGSLPVYDSDSSCVPYDLFRSVQATEERWWRKYIFEASQKIFTVHQAKEMSDVIAKAQTFLKHANRIYFLGFGYDKINMERLFIENDKNLLKEGGLSTKCWGTAMGISPHQKLYLGKFGLTHMMGDYIDEERGNTHRSLSFPDSTIYDFLYYNPFSKLE